MVQIKVIPLKEQCCFYAKTLRESIVDSNLLRSRDTSAALHSRVADGRGYKSAPPSKAQRLQDPYDLK